MGREGMGSHAPGGQLRFGEAGADSHRGPEQEGGHGEEGAAGHSPRSPSSPSTEGNESEQSEVKACAGRREAGNGRGGSLSTVPGDGCCVEPGGPCPALERGGAGSGLVWPVSGRCPGPSFQEGCTPPGAPVSLHASPLEEGHFFELHAWLSPDCAQTPQGRSGKIQSKPNTDIK